MSDDAGNSAKAQRETPDKSKMGTALTTAALDHDAERLVTAFVWVMRYDIRLAVAGSLLLVSLVSVFDVRVPCLLQIIGLATGLSAVVVGCWVGGQAVDLMDSPQVMQPVDVDLFDHDGAGVYTCPTPRWSEWTVVDGQLRWATLNLVFDHGVDLDAREIVGTWVGSLPNSMLARTLEYLWYNRRQLEPKARKGESLEVNSSAIVRAAAAKTVKHVVRTFEKGTLPDDGDVLHAEIDSAPEDFSLGGSSSILGEDPTEWTPGDDGPAPGLLIDLDQRWKQHTANGESE